MVEDDKRRDDEHYFPKSLLAQQPMLTGVTARLVARPNAYTRRFEDGPWRINRSLDPKPRDDKNVFLISSGYGVKRLAALKIVTIYEQKNNEPLPESERAKRYGQMHRECEIMDRLKECANTVTIYGHFTFSWREDEGEGEDLVILMEYLPSTLEETYNELRFLSAPHLEERESVARLSGGRDQYDEHQVFAVGSDLCAALEQCAHAGNASSGIDPVLHRDIKPANIFYDRAQGVYKLGDFGISRFLRDERQQVSTVALTPNYAAPERLRGESYDIRADIYSVGLVLYGLCNNGDVTRLPDGRLRSPAHGAASLRKVLAKACAYDPRERYQTVGELEKGLTAAREHDDAVPAAAMPEPAVAKPMNLSESDKKEAPTASETTETIVLPTEHEEETSETAILPQEETVETIVLPKEHKEETSETAKMPQKETRPSNSEPLVPTAGMPLRGRAIADAIPTVRGVLPNRGDEGVSGSSSKVGAYSNMIGDFQNKRSARMKRRFKIIGVLVALALIACVVLIDYSSRIKPSDDESGMQMVGVSIIAD